MSCLKIKAVNFLLMILASSALAFGVALDPRQRELFGPLGAPLAVGCSLGVVSFATAGLVPGYTGASMNPARCFAFAVTRHDFTGMSWKRLRSKDELTASV